MEIGISGRTLPGRTVNDLLIQLQGMRPDTNRSVVWHTLEFMCSSLLLKTATFHVWSLFFPYGIGLQLSRFVCARARAPCTIAARIGSMSRQSSGALLRQ